MIGHLAFKDGSRKRKVRALFDKQGPEAAWVLGLKLKLKQGTPSHLARRMAEGGVTMAAHRITIRLGVASGDAAIDRGCGSLV